VGVKEASGEMFCVVRGKLKDRERNDPEGVLMDVEYKGTCRGIWFPGVATLLGMDVGLEAKGSDVSWVDGSPSEWSVDGGIGYTGFDIGASPRQSGVDSRTSSLDSNSSQVLTPDSGPVRSPPASRQTSTSSTSSLLRAPLPAQNVVEYSFEGSTATVASFASSPVGTMSSMSSLMPASATNGVTRYLRPPAVPITLHINMNEIIAPAKNIFTFSISGTILITPRPSLARVNSQSSRREHDKDVDPDPFVLPRFTILAADSESTSVTIRNEIDGAPVNVEVYNATGDILKDAQARKTVLQKGGLTKCGEDGVRIALRTIGLSNVNGKLQTHSRPRTPNGSVVPQVPSNLLGRYPLRSKRDGPLLIPSVNATVTPLLLDGHLLPFDYAVRICLNAPADADSEWLEFGLAQPEPTSSTPLVGICSPHVVVASASINGIPVKFDTAGISRADASGAGVSFEEMGSKEWVSWLRVHVGALGGGTVVVDYVVREKGGVRTSKGKGKARNESHLNVLLPTFSIPVGRLEVCVDAASGLSSFFFRVSSGLTFTQVWAYLSCGRTSRTNIPPPRVTGFSIFLWRSSFIHICL